MQRPLLLKQPSVPAAIPGAAEEVLGLADSPQSRYRSSGPSSLGRRLELCLRYGHVESRQFQRTKLLPVLVRTKCCQSSRRPLLSYALFNGCFDLYEAEERARHGILLRSCHAPCARDWQLLLFPGHQGTSRASSRYLFNANTIQPLFTQCIFDHVFFSY